MAAWDAEENPYDVLGISLEDKPDEIKKKYRRLVLEKHPDKQPGNKKAAAEFIKIQRAYEILNDAKAKAAFDALQRAKQAREAKQSGQTEKRRKMAADLERREREFEAERKQERAARSRLDAELARLRKEMAEREAERQAVQLRERVAASLSAGTSLQPGNEAELQRTLKASWDATVGSYSEERLRGIFTAHGPVEDIILRQAKKKGKGSALVIMGSLQAAAAASEAVLGDIENPILVVPMAKIPGVGRPGIPRSPSPGQQMQGKSGLQAPSQASDRMASSLFPGFSAPPAGGKPLFAAFAGSTVATQTNSTNGGGGGVHTQYESGILAKMRRKAEQDKQRDAK